MLLLLWNRGIADGLTDTTVIHKPVDYQLAGEPPYKDRGITYELAPKKTTFKTFATRSGAVKLSGGRPSFTTRTDSRGYD